MPETLFRIGMSPDSRPIMYTYYTRPFFSSVIFSEVEWNQVFNHNHKPQSSREHFCIYMVTHCVDFREVAVDEYLELNQA
jgi:hypothetical protein